MNIKRNDNFEEVDVENDACYYFFDLININSLISCKCKCTFDSK